MAAWLSQGSPTGNGQTDRSSPVRDGSCVSVSIYTQWDHTLPSESRSGPEGAFGRIWPYFGRSGHYGLNIIETLCCLKQDIISNRLRHALSL